LFDGLRIELMRRCLGTQIPGQDDNFSCNDSFCSISDHNRAAPVSGTPSAITLLMSQLSKVFSAISGEIGGEPGQN